MGPITSKPYCLATFYRFTRVAEPRALRESLAETTRRLDLRGTILIAAEGINATVCGERAAIDALLDDIRSRPGFSGLAARYTESGSAAFRRMKVKLRREIVSMGVSEIEPATATGTHVTPQQWDALLDDPRVRLIDTRNEYETRIGTFRGATLPGTSHFREFPRWAEANLGDDKSKPVAMFCTGGIRCEKASAWLVAQGYEQVYQLDGGVLAYLEAKNSDDSRWEGDCFVFDERVAVDRSLRPTNHELCPGCRGPLGEKERSQPGYEPGVSCPHCYTTLTETRRRAFRERHRQQTLAEARGSLHLGARQGDGADTRGPDNEPQTESKADGQRRSR